ncbi:MAG TPA: branched-chain amino acid ABC transporter substrate-binding protein [Hyphomicrobium sp.]|nr:branched-chain amino acid ABC transporter substrate-binding protein [Hyphomicrobium sp.]
MTLKARLLALAAVAGLVASLSPRAVAGEFKIGLAAPLTGRMAPVGLSMQRALEAAVADTNANGGVAEDTLSLLVEDDGCASATAEGAAQRLIAQQAIVVIGHPCSNAAAASAPLYGRAGVLLIAVGPRHENVTIPKTAVTAPALRLAARDDRQGDIVASWLFDNSPDMRFAIIHDRTGYARRIVDGTVAKLKVSGVTPVALIPITAGRLDYADVAQKLRESGAQSMVFAGYPQEATLVIAATEKLGIAIPFLGTDTQATPEFAEFAEKARTRVQVLLPTELEPRVDDVGGDSVKAQGLRARGALEAWLEAVRKTGKTDGATLAQAMRGPRLMTRSVGEIQFDGNGDLVLDAFVTGSAHDGRWVRDD